jgi:hypothetical protein
MKMVITSPPRLKPACSLVFLLLSCQNTSDPTSMATCTATADSQANLSTAQLDSIASISTRDQDAQWAADALHVPGGFAGVYVQAVNQGSGSYELILLMVDTTQGPAAVDSLRVYDSTVVAPHGLQIVGINFKPVRWNWLQLYAWYRYLLYIPHSGLSLNGLTSTDMDEVQNRIALGFGTSSDSALAVQQIGALTPPCGLISIAVSAPATF